MPNRAGRPAPAAGWAWRRCATNLATCPEDLDEALTQLYRDGAVSLIPEENQKILTDEDRAAAVEIGDQAKHLIRDREVMQEAHREALAALRLSWAPTATICGARNGRPTSAGSTNAPSTR